jgi:toxin-antitoxin system PIN domain toxin
VTLADVNVLVAAHREDAAHHDVCHSWLGSLIHENVEFAVCRQVLAGVIRVETHPKIYQPPTPLDNVVGFVNMLLERPNCVVVEPGPEHWAIFCELCQQSKATGNLVQDAWYAALAIESGCTWITLDRDFSRFEGLRWREPS